MKLNSKLTLGFIAIIVGILLMVYFNNCTSHKIFNLEAIGIGVLTVGLISVGLEYFKKRKKKLTKK